MTGLESLSPSNCQVTSLLRIHTSNPSSNEIVKRNSSTYLPLSSCTSIKEDQIIEQYTVNKCSYLIISNINCYQSPIAKKLTPAFARDRALNKVAMVMAEVNIVNS